MAVLRDLAVLDTPAEPAFDDIAMLASVSCASPIAAVNFVDDVRHWTKAVVGVEGGQGASVSADLSFCAATVRTRGGLLTVPDTLADERWRSHPFVTGDAALGFYAGAAIVVSGQPVGVVCVYGDQPRVITEREEQALVALANQAATQLELGQRNAELHALALSDPLTGLPNRTLLFDRLEQALAQRAREGGQVGVLFCDVDGFKQVNDRLGHEVGDRLLCDLADRLRSATRDTDTLARFAGDEFVVVCPSLDGPHDLEAVVARVAQSIDDLGSADQDTPTLRLSVGAALSSDGETAADLLRRADEAMYEAKTAGRGARPD